MKNITSNEEAQILMHNVREKIKKYKSNYGLSKRRPDYELLEAVMKKTRTRSKKKFRAMSVKKVYALILATSWLRGYIVAHKKNNEKEDE